MTVAAMFASDTTIGILPIIATEQEDSTEESPFRSIRVSEAEVLSWLEEANAESKKGLTRRVRTEENR